MAGAFPAAQKAMQWETLPTANSKNNFSEPEKLFIGFPSRRPWEQAVSLSGAFPAAQSAVAMGDPSNWQIYKKNQGLKSCFLIFPSRHPWEQAVSFGPTPPSHVWTRLVPQKPRELPILMERGEVINSEFRFSEARYTI